MSRFYLSGIILCILQTLDLIRKKNKQLFGNLFSIEILLLQIEKIRKIQLNHIKKIYFHPVKNLLLENAK